VCVCVCVCTYTYIHIGSDQLGELRERVARLASEEYSRSFSPDHELAVRHSYRCHHTRSSFISYANLAKSLAEKNK
jgi:acetyl esterase/lipase